MTTSKIKGLSLVELMIVTAIVGVLAAIAIPAYSTYAARSAVANLLQMTDGIKLSVADYVVENNSLPTNAADLGIADAGDNTLVANMSANFLSAVRVSNHADTGTGGTISIDTTANGTYGVNSTITILIVPTLTTSGITWDCRPAAATIANDLTKYLPTDCRN